MTANEPTTKKTTIEDQCEQVKKITRSIFNKIERVMLNRPVSAEAAAKEEKQHERVFGKTSMAATLVALTELLIKLEQAEKNQQAEIAPNPLDATTPADMVLVESFIRRMQQREQVSVPPPAEMPSQNI